MAETYRIVARACSVKRVLDTGLTYERALEICEYENWEYCPDGEGGFVWDMEIDEED